LRNFFGGVFKIKAERERESRVGKKVVNMSIDRAGGQYWLKPVNTGQYWSNENSMVSVGFFWSF
jgi:hypothetical protein